MYSCLKGTITIQVKLSLGACIRCTMCICMAIYVGLTMNPHRLQKVREVRAGHFAEGVLDNYVDAREISRELRYANALIAKHGWRSVDVSYQGIEEVAKEVLLMMGK